MRRIEIDDEVYAELGNHVKGFEQPNDVLRRILGLIERSPSVNQGAAASTPPSIRGALSRLLDKGVIKAGDTLSHTQVRKGRTLTGTVEPDGWVRTELNRYKEPSPALGGLVGTAIDGWAYWTHEPSGKTLRQLRSDIGGTGRGGR